MTMEVPRHSVDVPPQADGEDAPVPGEIDAASLGVCAIEGIAYQTITNALRRQELRARGLFAGLEAEAEMWDIQRQQN
jgi:hypothetical protein